MIRLGVGVVLPAALAAALAGCGPAACAPGEGSDRASVNLSPVAPGTKARPANQWSQKLYDMQGAGRLAALKGLIESSGNPCDSVTAGVLKGHEGKVDMWHVTCGNGDWMVSIDEDSSTKTLSCETLASIGSDCNKAWAD